MLLFLASGHEDILAYFLQQGTAPILVDARDNENATPTHDAVEYGYATYSATFVPLIIPLILPLVVPL